MRKQNWIIAIVIILLIGGVAYALAQRNNQTSAQTGSANTSTQTNFSPTAPSKSGGCVAANGLPDPACTPGAVISTATKEDICVSGYSKTVRNVPAAEKRAVYEEYGIASHVAGEFEVDHLISLELGGSNDISNLWPEAADPKPGFHQKDGLENTLHAQVCAGTISLAEAQKEIATNWLQNYAPR